MVRFVGFGSGDGTNVPSIGRIFGDVSSPELVFALPTGNDLHMPCGMTL